jgi:hemerythrin-like domain-containing protein
MKSPAGTPGPDFDHPLEMLAACHDRIEERLDVLQRLLAHLPAHGCDEQAQQAATNVMRYFDTAGEHHHEDEEANLFPALAASKADDTNMLELIARLQREHEVMRALWQSLRIGLKRIADGVSADLDRGLVERFSAVYREHIEFEEAELLPLAERVLSAEEHAALGAAMAQRRGVKR